MRGNKEFLGTEPIGKLLFRLSVPTVAAQLINMLYNVVDRIYIGHMPGEGSLALTGVGVCMPLIMLVSAFAALISSGGAPRASIFMGKQDLESAEKALGNCFGLQFVVSGVLTVVLLLWNKEMLMAFGASENTIVYASDYMAIYAVGTLFVQLTLGMNSFITAQGFTTVSMMSVVIGAVCNIGLDPLFIFTFGMGVRGAALATILSQAMSCLWIMLFLCGRKTRIRIRLKNIKLQARVILPCVALGAATFVMQASESVISVCFNASLLRYGGDIAVGAMTILVSVMQFAMLPMMGVAQGSQPIMSYNYGAKAKARVKKTYRLLLVVCLSYSMALWLMVMLVPQAFVRIFTPEADLVAYAAPALRIYMAGIGLFGIQIACQMAFTSLGKAVNSIVVAVVRKFILLLPLIFLLPHLVQDKTRGVYLAEPVADVLAVAFTAVLFIFQFKKALREMEADGKAVA